MAVINDTIQLSAGLVSTYLSDPPIGASGVVALAGYDPAKSAIDQLKALTSTPAALNAALTIAADEYGLLRVSNPNAVAVTLAVGATALGIIPPGTATAPACVLIPIGNGVVINASVASGTYSVGVTVIHASKNT